MASVRCIIGLLFCLRFRHRQYHRIAHDRIMLAVLVEQHRPAVQRQAVQFAVFIKDLRETPAFRPGRKRGLASPLANSF